MVQQVTSQIALVTSAVCRMWRKRLSCKGIRSHHQQPTAQAPPIAQRCFRHQLLLPRPYLVLTKPLRLDIQCQRGASVKIGWKYLDD